jgi:hypothetical protein
MGPLWDVASLTTVKSTNSKLNISILNIVHLLNKYELENLMFWKMLSIGWIIMISLTAQTNKTVAENLWNISLSVDVSVTI